MSEPVFRCSNKACGHEGPADDFYVVLGRRRSRCKDCDRKVAREWRKVQTFRSVNLNRWHRIQDLAVRIIDRLGLDSLEDRGLAEELRRAFLGRDLAAARARSVAPPLVLPITKMQISVSLGQIRLTSVDIIIDRPDAKVLLLEGDSKNGESHGGGTGEGDLEVLLVASEYTSFAADSPEPTRVVITGLGPHWNIETITARYTTIVFLWYLNPETVVLKTLWISSESEAGAKIAQVAGAAERPRPGRWVSIAEKLPGEGWGVEVVQERGGRRFPAKFKGGEFLSITVFGLGDPFPEGWVAFWRGDLGVFKEDLPS